MKYTVADVVRVRAAEDPDRLAISSEDGAVTWTELYRNARRVAAALAASGIKPQERVSFIDRNCIEFFEFIFGRSEEHTSELQSLMRISYAVFCLKKKKNTQSLHIHI